MVGQSHHDNGWPHAVGPGFGKKYMTAFKHTPTRIMQSVKDVSWVPKWCMFMLCRGIVNPHVSCLHNIMWAHLASHLATAAPHKSWASFCPQLRRVVGGRDNAVVVQQATLWKRTEMIMQLVGHRQQAP